jgi:hypothetical protein
MCGWTSLHGDKAIATLEGSISQILVRNWIRLLFQVGLVCCSSGLAFDLSAFYLRPLLRFSMQKMLAQRRRLYYQRKAA